MAVEVLNAAMKKRANLSSLGWALAENKGLTAGSDGHRLEWLGNAVTCSEGRDIHSFLDSIRKKKNYIVGQESTLAAKLVSELTIFVKNKI